MTRRQADLTLLLATFLWGTTFAVVKDALAAATPLAFLTLRFSIAALLLAPGTRFRPPPAGRELRGGLLLGALVALGFISQTAGLVITTASRSAFIVAISSVLAPVIALALLGQRPGWLTVAALALANRGDLLTLVCAVCFGGQIVAVTTLGREYDARRLVWFQVAGTAVVSAGALLLLERPRIQWSGGFLAAHVYSVLFASTICFLLQMSAQRHMSAARAALIFCFEPLFAALTSWLVLGERLAMLQWLGGGFIVLGMIAADLPASRAASAAGP